MKWWLSNSAADARFSASKVRAFVRNVLKLKKTLVFPTKFNTVSNENENLCEIVFQLLNSGLPLEAIKNIALIGDSFMYGGWPWIEDTIYDGYSP